jgi:hypothetical protein
MAVMDLTQVMFVSTHGMELHGSREAMILTGKLKVIIADDQ